MSHPAITPEQRFAAIVGELLNHPGVTPPEDGPQARRMFGASALKIHNKIFAMLSKGKLVIKLPKPRVDALIASGAGESVDLRKAGRPFKEWIALEPTSEEEWLPLAKEAMEFVASKR